MKSKNAEVGLKGEQAAVLHLEKAGYYILQTNYRTKTGEIDIIAQNPQKDYLVFIEVKTRRISQNGLPLKYGLPSEAVNTRKQRKIINTALSYICQNGLNLNNISCRFDVLEVLMKDGSLEYNHIISAFGE